jgi:pimeloyl-ACP methyl ester carboxylesterase
MRRCVLLGILTFAAAVSAAPAHAAEVQRGPAGLKFYTPPKTLPKGTHGAPIWARGLTSKSKLQDASSNELLLYRSTSTNGKTTAVSGSLAVPKGKAPKHGWPIVTWAHGTTGIADSCAPSIVDTQAGYDHALLQRWLKAGYAVVRTDYEGLGTPGDHPYLIGVSEGRSVLDVVRAARKFDPSLGKEVVIAGHSQGGQAALWAASIAKQWTPELNVRGTVAFAPVSHLSEQAPALRLLTSPSGLTGLAAMILRGAEIDDPALNVPALLSDPAKTLYPQTLTECLSALDAPNSFGGIAPANLLRPDADLTAVEAELSAKADPEDLTIHTPVLVEQGLSDSTVFPSFTEQLVTAFHAHGNSVVYKTYPNIDHGGIVNAAAADATSFMKQRF